MIENKKNNTERHEMATTNISPNVATAPPLTGNGSAANPVDIDDTQLKTIIKNVIIYSGGETDWYNTAKKEVENNTYKGRNIGDTTTEPLIGWYPFKDVQKVGGPMKYLQLLAQSNASAANIFQTTIMPGDYFDMQLNNETWRFIVADFNHYQSATNTKPHFTVVGGRATSNTVQFKSSGNTDYSTSNLKTWLDSTFYNYFSADQKACIYNTHIPSFNYNKTYKTITANIFTPSAIELFGTTQYGTDSKIDYGTSGKEPNIWFKYVFSNDAERIRSKSVASTASMLSALPTVVYAGAPAAETESVAEEKIGEAAKAASTESDIQPMATNASNVWYWTRSASSYGSSNVVRVNAGGSESDYDVDYNYYALPCFNIA